MRANSENDTLLNRLILLIACALALLAPGAILPLHSTGAQDATPEPTPACDLPPRSITFIADVISAPRPETTGDESKEKTRAPRFGWYHLSRQTNCWIVLPVRFLA